MKSSMLRDDNDVQKMRELRKRIGSKSTIVDFEEQILLTSIRAMTRIWKQDDQTVGFAFVDEYNNLWFEAEPEFALLNELETEIVGWGLACIKSRTDEAGTHPTLDCTCDAEDTHRLDVLRSHGFTPEPVRSLRYVRSLDDPITNYPFPSGFSIRSVKGKDEVEQLVALHRAAFGTTHMTVEYRLAMMSVPQYRGELDLVVVAPNQELAAFCVCGFDDPDNTMGYTDPIGTHPLFQRMGLGKAVTSTGLIALKRMGARAARLGTSSENIAMQKLAIALGFICVSEKLWFSKAVL